MEDNRNEMDKKRETVLKWLQENLPDMSFSIEEDMLQDECAVDFAMKEIERGVKGTHDVNRALHVMLQLTYTD